VIPGLFFVYICKMAVLLGSLEDYREMYYNFISDEFGTYKDQAISNLGYRLKTTSDSWRRHGSRGYIERPEFRAAYIDNTKGIPLDIIADLASESGLNITPDDVVEFMKRYPGGKGNKDSKSLKTFYGKHNPANVLPEYKKEFLKSLKAPKQKPAKAEKKQPEKKTGQVLKYLPQRGNSNEAKDTARPFAMSPGKRISKNGKIYWETRKNRSDDFLTGIVKL
jgi:hypothetical protein